MKYVDKHLLFPDYVGLSENFLDVILVVGASNPTYFRLEKEAILEMARQQQNTSVNYIYGVIQYGNSAVIKKSLKERMNNKDLQAFVESLVMEEPGKALLDAIDQAKLSFEQHGRPKARKVLAVFSDASIGDDPFSAFQEPGEKLRQDGVKIMGVTVNDERGDVDDKMEGLTGKKPFKIDDDHSENTPERIGRKIAQQTVTSK